MIGIIGGYGDVGLQAARMLKEWGKQPLRLGGRNPETAQANLGDEFPQAEWVKVDIEDERSLESFLNGCKLIVNCAGPSHRTAARVAVMCLSKGCHHVDAGTGKNLEMMRGTPQSTVVLYAAGATPGLSGLLPRWLAKFFDQVDSMICYTGAFDRFTASAAEDYFAGISGNDNKPLAAWKNGACRSSALHRRSKTQLPFFSREVTLYPYFNAEAEFVAASLSLCDGEWYMAIDGTHVPSVLEEVCAQFLTDRQSAVKRLCTASELDLAGRRKYMNFIIQLNGIKNGTEITRTLVLQADSPSVLTGSVAAVAGIAILEGEMPSGVRPLAEIPDPDKVIARLNNTQFINRLIVLERSVDKLLQAVEGEI
ncbi:Saccharopine dehydrogenase [Sporomusa ovata DSM 2662]|uniref:Putative reductoisomerase in siderophore biosynthesis gene cluster n=1 Tax=Sporomusa ovata TaxID=2378 RepID=A0A0U1L3H1_9FIRM|nr:saccharopine dehydrogenase NADP-binding domain-containing protein [Sporomusa ovata]EQB25312.1 saccharopine dehydrogenase [Sporomusa ovata DSM 2662]CQR73879.1 Putative reductoisomerase in siderophore biosynthesis gene cluster [Sporomusa ovata]